MGKRLRKWLLREICMIASSIWVILVYFCGSQCAWLKCLGASDISYCLHLQNQQKAVVTWMPLWHFISDAMYSTREGMLCKRWLSQVANNRRLMLRLVFNSLEESLKSDTKIVSKLLLCYSKDESMSLVHCSTLVDSWVKPIDCHRTSIILDTQMF